MDWIKQFHLNEYVPFLVNQYQKKNLKLNQKDPLAPGKDLSVSKQPGSNIEEYTVDYFTKNTLFKQDAWPKMEQVCQMFNQTNSFFVLKL